jgi:hypothetical protein
MRWLVKEVMWSDRYITAIYWRDWRKPLKTWVKTADDGASHADRNLTSVKASAGIPLLPFYVDIYHVVDYLCSQSDFILRSATFFSFLAFKVVSPAACPITKFNWNQLSWFADVFLTFELVDDSLYSRTWKYSTLFTSKQQINKHTTLTP